MKIVLVGINSKYIHPNLAIRYLKANCDFDVEILEFTIKDDTEKIVNAIIESKPDILGFSVYIWNYQIVLRILTELKENHSRIKIVLGGPEVSYESEDLIEKELADYIICGEAEKSFNDLIKAIPRNDLADVLNLIYKSDDKVVRNPKAYIKDLNTINNPYYLFDETIENQIAYIELSRGCPYNCSYCMASLDGKLRYFELERVKKNIDYLYQKGARTFKFLDRSFNIKPDLAMEFFDYIIKSRYADAVFQFEINGDILKADFIDYLKANAPANYIRFEIGIQSIHDEVNKAVYRHQNTEALLNNIRSLVDSPVILHLDLIAGLPYETLDKFIQTFDTVFKLYGDELQLGFLKILKGTRLYYEAADYGYIYDADPPYELKENRFISRWDLEKIHIVEDCLDIFWNRGFMNESIKHLLDDFASPFEFFYDLGIYLQEKKFDLHKYQLFELFKVMEEFVTGKFPSKPNIDDVLRLDYLDHFKIKPKIYWDNSRIKKNEIVRMFHKTHQEYCIDDLYKYAFVTEYFNQYLLIIYQPGQKRIYKIKPQNQ